MTVQITTLDEIACPCCADEFPNEEEIVREIMDNPQSGAIIECLHCGEEFSTTLLVRIEPF